MNPTDPNQPYVQSLVLVTSLLVTNFSLLVITRSHEFGFARNLVEIHPTGLSDLSKQLRYLNRSQKTTTEIQYFRKIEKI